jgi:hypothetical protein
MLFILSLGMSRQRAYLSPEEVYSIKLLKVQLEWDLNMIVYELVGKLKTMLCIHRVYDFIKKSRCDEVIIGIRSNLEYETIKAKRSVVIRGKEINVDASKLIIRSATRPNDLSTKSSEAINGAPFSLKIGKLREVSKFPVYYMWQLLTAFESGNRDYVIGLSFRYDGLRDAIRPFGFVTFKDRNSLKLYDKNGVNLFREHYECEESYHVPIIVSKFNEFLLTPPIKYTQVLHDVNLISGVAQNQSVIQSVNDGMNANFSAMPDNNEPFEEGASDDAESILSGDINFEFDEDCNVINFK